MKPAIASLIDACCIIPQCIKLSSCVIQGSQSVRISGLWFLRKPSFADYITQINALQHCAVRQQFSGRPFQRFFRVLSGEAFGDNFTIVFNYQTRNGLLCHWVNGTVSALLKLINLVVKHSQVHFPISCNKISPTLWRNISLLSGVILPQKVAYYCPLKWRNIALYGVITFAFHVASYCSLYSCFGARYDVFQSYLNISDYM